MIATPRDGNRLIAVVVLALLAAVRAVTDALTALRESGVAFFYLSLWAFAGWRRQRRYDRLRHPRGQR